ncbi:hypothetical protein HNY73_007273 [Argiope bruennichi]|uniref:Uncharacterized protein n=1 Tax=Argiope bruennichi TaxID=94029 RepID=A0A8T0FG29_ARGBR|nr:hypothetical protein HNY73_007273 [Argiope bruennichi]
MGYFRSWYRLERCRTIMVDYIDHLLKNMIVIVLSHMDSVECLTILMRIKEVINRSAHSYRIYGSYSFGIINQLRKFLYKFDDDSRKLWWKLAIRGILYKEELPLIYNRFIIAKRLYNQMVDTYSDIYSLN